MAEEVHPQIPREVHEKWMKEAIAMAELAIASDETPVGCVFVHKNAIIGRGMNDTNRSLNGTRHAEFIAMTEVLKSYPQSIFQETDLYVTVEPCIMCASALRQIGLRKCYYGCMNERFGGAGGFMDVATNAGIDPPLVCEGGYFKNEAIMLLRRFYVQENTKAPKPKNKKNRVLKEIEEPKETNGG